jgi:hypothetical protein
VDEEMVGGKLVGIEFGGTLDIILVLEVVVARKVGLGHLCVSFHVLVEFGVSRVATLDGDGALFAFTFGLLVTLGFELG